MRIVLPVLAICLALTAPAFGVEPAAPSGGGAEKGYWIERSRILDTSDPRSQRASGIFERVLAAADRLPGPSPELVILDEEGFPWARSLPDGSILLTRGAIDVALKAGSPEDADARLAFILGHELSHHVNGDFWHFFFYQGVNSGVLDDERSRAALEEAKEIAKSGDNVSAKELQADQYGLLYASQAGYNVKRIVDTDTNFFREWTAATNPALLEGVVMQVTHPKIEERSAAALLTMKRVVDKIGVFEKGVEAYKKGSYVAAKFYLEDFLSAYQSREAFNNLGLVYYRMAMAERIQWKPGESSFRLSLIADPVTRARRTLTKKDERSPLARSLRTRGGHEERFDKYATAAGRYFREAAQRDPTYALTHSNLACVHFLRGETSGALGEVDRALAIDPALPEALNNRAVIYLRLGSELGTDLAGKAEADLLKAVDLRPDYGDAIFNLAWFYKNEGRERELQTYTDKFSEVEPESPLLSLLR